MSRKRFAISSPWWEAAVLAHPSVDELSPVTWLRRRLSVPSLESCSFHLPVKSFLDRHFGVCTFAPVFFFHTHGNAALFTPLNLPVCFPCLCWRSTRPVLCCAACRSVVPGTRHCPSSLLLAGSGTALQSCGPHRELATGPLIEYPGYGCGGGEPDRWAGGRGRGLHAGVAGGPGVTESGLGV